MPAPRPSMGYAGDLSSTFPVSPTFSARQRTIYEIQLASHRAAVDLLAPGVPNREVHFAACRVIAEGMKDLGLMKGNTEDALAAGAHAMFFPCGVGHLMGLDVHDMEDLGEVQVGWAGEPKSTQFGLKSLRLAREARARFRRHRRAGDLLHPPAHGPLAFSGPLRGVPRFRQARPVARLRRSSQRGGLPHHRRRRPPARSAKPETVKEVESLRG